MTDSSEDKASSSENKEGLAVDKAIGDESSFIKTNLRLAAESDDSNWTLYRDPAGATIRLDTAVPHHPIIPLHDMRELYPKRVQWFEPRDDDVWFATYPRSGTHWMWSMANMIITNRFDLTEFIYKDKDTFDFSYQTDDPLKSRISPRRINTHMIPSLLPPSVIKRNKFIVIMRNPKDVAVSNFFHVKRNEPEAFQYHGDWNGYFRLHMAGQVDRGDWFDHVLPWWNLSKEQDNIFIAKYEDMSTNCLKVLEDLGKFLGYERSTETYQKIINLCSFKQMKHLDKPEDHRDDGSNVQRLGKVGDWKNYFTVEQNEEMDKVFKERMAGSGLDFRFEN